GPAARSELLRRERTIQARIPGCAIVPYSLAHRGVDRGCSTKSPGWNGGDTMRRVLVPTALLALLIVGGCSKQEETATTGGAPPPPGAASTPAPAPAGGTALTIAVIPKGTTHAFWKSVESGARAAGQELSVTINWKGPLKENDRAQQIAIVQQFVSDRVSGICLAPLDDTALQQPVHSAMEKGTPVVIFDSALK